MLQLKYNSSFTDFRMSFTKWRMTTGARWASSAQFGWDNVFRLSETYVNISQTYNWPSQNRTECLNVRLVPPGWPQCESSGSCNGQNIWESIQRAGRALDHLACAPVLFMSRILAALGCVRRFALYTLSQPHCKRTYLSATFFISVNTYSTFTKSSIEILFIFYRFSKRVLRQRTYYCTIYFVVPANFLKSYLNASIYTLSHRECGQLHPRMHENFEKFE